MKHPVWQKNLYIGTFLSIIYPYIVYRKIYIIYESNRGIQKTNLYLICHIDVQLNANNL